MKPWTREDTRHWLDQLENRIEDIYYYLNKTTEWCEDNDVYDDKVVFVCASMTVVWVSTMRGEQISQKEVFEIVGVPNLEILGDLEFCLRSEYLGLDLEELLEEVINRFS